MKKEKILKFDKMLKETSVYARAGLINESNIIFAKANEMIVKDTLESITPMSNQTAPYVIASLRVITDMIEATLSEQEKKPIKIAENYMRLYGTIDVKEEEINEINDEESRE